MKRNSVKYKKRLISALLSGSMLLSMGAAALATDAEEPIDQTEQIEEITEITDIAEQSEQTLIEEPEEAAQTETEETEQIEAVAQMEAVFAMAAPESTADLSQSGYALKRLGLVNGDANGDLMLTKIGTRAEALTLFVSLVGETKTAQANALSYTFRDIPAWFARTVGYGVYKQYTNGYSESTFGSNDAVTLEQYATFLLRALGYTVSDWRKAPEQAVAIGLCTQEQLNTWKSKSFLRQEVMEMSYLALSTKLCGSNSTLADRLIAQGVISQQAAQQEGLTCNTGYTAVNKTSSAASGVSSTKLTAGKFELHNVGTGKIMTASASKQTDVVLAADTNAANQQFQIINNSDGSFRIACTNNTSYCVDTNPTSGADAIIWTANNSACQNFIAVKYSTDTYSIRLASNPSAALTAVGTDVRLSSYTGAKNQLWKLSDNSEDTAAATTKLKSIMKLRPSGTSLGSGYTFAGASQCMGFGREIFYRMYGKTARWSYDGSPKTSSDASLYTVTATAKSYASSSIRALISKAKPGDILQMNTPKMHTMVFVSSDSNGFTVYDANWTGPNKVSVRYVSYGAWTGRNSSGICVLHATNYPTK